MKNDEAREVLSKVRQELYLMEHELDVIDTITAEGVDLPDYESVFLINCY